MQLLLRTRVSRVPAEMDLFEDCLLYTSDAADE